MRSSRRVWFSLRIVSRCFLILSRIECTSTFMSAKYWRRLSTSSYTKQESHEIHYRYFWSVKSRDSFLWWPYSVSILKLASPYHLGGIINLLMKSLEKDKPRVYFRAWSTDIAPLLLSVRAFHFSNKSFDSFSRLSNVLFASLLYWTTYCWT